MRPNRPTPRSFRDWPLRAKLLTLVLIASVLPLAASALVTYRAARSQLENDAVALLTARAEHLEHHTDDFNRQNLETARPLAASERAREIAAARRLVGIITAVGALLILFALGAGAFISHHAILEPIRRLSRAARALGGGDRTARVPVRSADEVGELGRAFNAMAASLAASHDDLERRVGERTQALAESNAQLEQRNRILAERTDEISRRQAQAMAYAHTLERLEEELRAHQVELEGKNREIERANNLKSEFIANMSHELRTPLNAVIGYADLLLDDTMPQLGGTQTRFVRDIRASGHHLLGLINQILDLSKIEAGRMTLEIETIAPAVALAEARVLVDGAASGRRVNVRELVEDPPTVEADAGKLRQILVNLLSNAVKFSPEGGTVEVGARRDGTSVRFWVRDQGPGLPGHLLPRLFQPFVQGEDPLVKHHEGTGLGLAISRRLVEAHDGTIEVSSRPDQGTTFSFTIPCRSKIRLPPRSASIASGPHPARSAPASPASGRGSEQR